MGVQHRGRPGQRGITLIGLLFWAIVVGFLALLGMRGAQGQQDKCGEGDKSGLHEHDETALA